MLQLFLLIDLDSDQLLLGWNMCLLISDLISNFIQPEVLVREIERWKTGFSLGILDGGEHYVLESFMYLKIISSFLNNFKLSRKDEVNENIKILGVIISLDKDKWIWKLSKEDL